MPPARSLVQALAFFAATAGATATGIAYIHASQKEERAQLRQGVERDLQRLAAKRAQQQQQRAGSER